MPRGFQCADEVQLHKPNALIDDEVSRALENWWFKVPGRASPNWDLASQCLVGSGKAARRGILLVEAKAHSEELGGERGGKKLSPGASRKSRVNHDRIGNAIDEANVSLRSLTGDQGWGLSRDNCYQISNRFAWAWKLADLCMPVVLVYLGFLAADEMADKGDLFSAHADWVACVKAHAKGIVPEEAWGRNWKISDRSLLVPRIMSVRQSLSAARVSSVIKV